MKYITNVAIGLKGDRVERGKVIEMTEAEANALHGDVSPFEGGAEEEEDAPEEKAIDEMTVDELKAKAEEYGLSKSGSKADLIERIKLHEEGGAEEEELSEDDNED